MNLSVNTHVQSMRKLKNGETVVYCPNEHIALLNKSGVKYNLTPNKEYKVIEYIVHRNGQFVDCVKLSDDKGVEHEFYYSSFKPVIAVSSPFVGGVRGN